MHSDTPSTAAEGRGGRLTTAQRSLLTELGVRDEYVVDAYLPGRALVKVGFAKERRRPDTYGAFLSITDAGREALSREKAGG